MRQASGKMRPQTTVCHMRSRRDPMCLSARAWESSQAAPDRAGCATARSAVAVGDDDQASGTTRRSEDKGYYCYIL